MFKILNGLPRDPDTSFYDTVTVPMYNTVEGSGFKYFSVDYSYYEFFITHKIANLKSLDFYKDDQEYIVKSTGNEKLQKCLQYYLDHLNVSGGMYAANETVEAPYENGIEPQNIYLFEVTENGIERICKNATTPCSIVDYRILHLEYHDPIDGTYETGQFPVRVKYTY